MVNIDINKIKEALKLDFQITEDIVLSNDNNKVKSYVFRLNEKQIEKSSKLIIDEDKLNQVFLSVIDNNQYNSTISISSITNVIYSNEFRFVEFISETESNYSKLKVWWRGQFDFVSYSKDTKI